MPSVIDQFAEAARTKDFGPLSDLLADDVRFYGMPWQPFEGKESVKAAVAMLHAVLEELSYVAEFEGPTGLVLQLRGKVRGRTFDGAQILTFSDDGRITECRDLMRPYSAIQALFEAATEYLGQPAKG